MTARAVHWHDGMFLRPHHFQANERHRAQIVQRSEKWHAHYNWGLREIELDRSALANFRLAIRSLQAVMPDGTAVAVPEDGQLPEVDLKPAFEQTSTLTVFLGLPQLNLGQPNVTGGPSDELARWRLTELDLEDENTGVNPQPLKLRLFNLKLLLSTQDQTGFTVLPLARIEKSPRANAAPQVDVSYIPPLVAVDAWSPLSADIVQSVHDRLGRKADLIAQQLRARPHEIDPVLVGQLRELNSAAAALGVLAFAQGVPPLTSYVELCRLVGQLSIYKSDMRSPPLPRYDHDDLGGCFWAVKRHLDELLDLFLEPDYKERPFVGAGLRMQVGMDANWLDPVWGLFIGVQSTLEPSECLKLLTVPGQLDMKIGAGDRVDQLFRMGQAGLRFDACPRPPLLPEREKQAFFQISRGDGSSREWQHVQRALTLALRLNENRVIGNIQDQHELTVRCGTQAAKMQFTLYVVPQVK